MDGNDVKSANAAYNQSSSTSTKEPVVQLALKKKAAEVFGEATTKAASSGESIGIYYDDHFISVPKVEVQSKTEAVLSTACRIMKKQNSLQHLSV